MADTPRKVLKAAIVDLKDASRAVIDREYAEHRLQVNNGQDIEFRGRVIGEYSTQNANGTKDRWTEIRLWETRSRNWIVERVGCSNRHGDANLRDTLVIDTATCDDDELIEDVMDFLGWTIVAKAFAREMGWEVVRHVA